MTADELAQRLRAVGAPTTPAEVGVTRRRSSGSYLLSRTIRSRYSVLDLATETQAARYAGGGAIRAGGSWERV
ncbi:MAG: hypothetical protein U0641_12110 [Anaerolineae bacterium]